MENRESLLHLWRERMNLPFRQTTNRASPRAHSRRIKTDLEVVWTTPTIGSLQKQIDLSKWCFHFPGGGLRLRLPVSLSMKLVNGGGKIQCERRYFGHDQGAQKSYFERAHGACHCLRQEKLATESPWPLHFKHSHLRKRQSRSKFELLTMLEGPTEYGNARWM